MSESDISRDQIVEAAQIEMRRVRSEICESRYGGDLARMPATTLDEEDDAAAQFIRRCVPEQAEVGLALVMRATRGHANPARVRKLWEGDGR